jgi:hypothetical protein
VSPLSAILLVDCDFTIFGPIQISHSCTHVCKNSAATVGIQPLFLNFSDLNSNQTVKNMTNIDGFWPILPKFDCTVPDYGKYGQNSIGRGRNLTSATAEFRLLLLESRHR